MNGEITCNHATKGLCPTCQADYEADGLSWLEYGHHPAGEQNWADLQAEMDAERQQVAAEPAYEPDPDMPY